MPNLQELHFFDLWLEYIRRRAHGDDYTAHSAELDRRIREKTDTGLSVRDAMQELMKR